jgi:hypothetical protein
MVIRASIPLLLSPYRLCLLLIAYRLLPLLKLRRSRSFSSYNVRLSVDTDSY